MRSAPSPVTLAPGFRLSLSFAHDVRASRTHWQCRRCRHQTTATAGTIFASTELPLTVWFLAMHFLAQAKNNVSALELMHHQGYSAAWRIKHKILHTVARRESRRQLSGRVEIDDAYLGGEHPGKRGRGSPNKVPFVIGVSTVRDNRSHQVAICCTPFTKNAISHWVHTALDADAQAWSDGLSAFGALWPPKWQSIIPSLPAQGVLRPGTLNLAA